MDQEPLRQLYRKYQNEIYLYLYTLSHNRELAKDLTQETFLKAILSLANDHVNVRAWLYLVARNLYRNYWNREKRCVPLPSEEIISSEDENPLSQVICDEKKRLLYEALQHLPKQQREILELQYFGGLPQKEIAAILKLTPENIRVQAYRGKKALREFMEVNGYDLS